MNLKYANAGLGFGLGALLWHFSPDLFGRKEPWDASVGIYLTCIFIFGLVSAIPSPRHFLIGPLSIFIGQFSYIWIVHGPGNLWPLSLAFGFVFYVPRSSWQFNVSNNLQGIFWIKEG